MTQGAQVDPSVRIALTHLMTMYRSVHTNDRRNTPAVP